MGLADAGTYDRHADWFRNFVHIELGSFNFLKAL
jgi:hypothetical protein